MQAIFDCLLGIVITGRDGACIRQVSFGGGILSLGVREREGTLTGSLFAGPVPVRHPQLVCSLQVLLPLRLIVLHGNLKSLRPDLLNQNPQGMMRWTGQ